MPLVPDSPARCSSSDSPRPSLVEGRFMRCPNCELLRDPTDDRQFKRLDRIDKYAHELNVIYQCVKNRKKKIGCGHVFSPGNPEIIQAYLAGDLVPAPHTVNNGNKEEREVVSA